MSQAAFLRRPGLFYSVFSLTNFPLSLLPQAFEKIHIFLTDWPIDRGKSPVYNV